MDGKYVCGAEIKKILGVADATLREWADTGKIKSFRTPGGQRRYEISEMFKAPTAITKPKNGIVYARVSSGKQRDDLDRQIAFLRIKYPDHIVITDIASGINWKRKGLKTILELANKGDIYEVVVAARDRLCRFAFELIEHILSINSVRITVLDAAEMSPEQELSDDLLSIVQIFCCRRNGKRRYTIKAGDADEENQNQPHESSETDAE
jgi:predicted site-specific integrase-resolvase